MKPARWLALGVTVFAFFFALLGGEYSTFDLLKLRRQEHEVRDSLLERRRLVDSLAKMAVAVETDPETQERIARESWGMIRPGEYFYSWVAP